MAHSVSAAPSASGVLRSFEQCADGIDLTRLGESHHLLALGAIISGVRGGFLEDADDLVVSAPGKCTEITFLSCA